MVYVKILRKLEVPEREFGEPGGGGEPAFPGQAPPVATPLGVVTPI